MHKFGVGQMFNVLMSYCHQGCIIELKYCTIVIDSCDEKMKNIYSYYYNVEFSSVLYFCVIRFFQDFFDE